MWFKYFMYKKKFWEKNFSDSIDLYDIDWGRSMDQHKKTSCPASCYPNAGL